MRTLATIPLLLLALSANATEPETRTLGLANVEIYALVVEYLTTLGKPFEIVGNQRITYANGEHEFVLDTVHAVVNALANMCQAGSFCERRSTRLVDCGDGRAWFYWWRTEADNWGEESLRICGSDDI